MTFMASWPGGQSAHETEREAEVAASAAVRAGKGTSVVWEIDQDDRTVPETSQDAAGATQGQKWDRDATTALEGAERTRP